MCKLWNKASKHHLNRVYRPKVDEQMPTHTSSPKRVTTSQRAVWGGSSALTQGKTCTEPVTAPEIKLRRLEIFSSKVNHAKIHQLLYLYTTGSQISHTLVLVGLSPSPWGLSSLQRTWEIVPPALGGGGGGFILPMQTCMAWGNRDPAFKAKILKAKNNEYSRRYPKKRKGKSGSAAQRPCGNLLFEASTAVRVALGKALDWSINLRGADLGSCRWERTVRLFLEEKNTSVLLLYLYSSVPEQRMVHWSKINKQL